MVKTHVKYTNLHFTGLTLQGQNVAEALCLLLKAYHEAVQWFGAGPPTALERKAQEFLNKKG